MTGRYSYLTIKTTDQPFTKERIKFHFVLKRLTNHIEIKKSSPGI